jgi:hypothetical protein
VIDDGAARLAFLNITEPWPGEKIVCALSSLPGTDGRSLPFEDEPAAGLVIGTIRSKEIDCHAIQFLPPMAGERIAVFGVDTALVLLSEYGTEFGIFERGEWPRS